MITPERKKGRAETISEHEKRIVQSGKEKATRIYVALG